jgi:nucleoid-associated protein YgaU
MAEERNSGKTNMGASPFSSTKVLAEHKVKEGDTLGSLALQYYGSANKDYWMVIYEMNKRAIGDDPNKVKLGLLLKIPELPPNLKMKK